MIKVNPRTKITLSFTKCKFLRNFIVVFFFVSVNPLFAQVEIVRDQHTEAVSVNPINSHTVYSASTWRLFKSNNQGDTWSNLYTFPQTISIRQVYIHPGDTNILLLNCISTDSLRGVYISDDCGKTFCKVLNASSNGQTLYGFDSILFFASKFPPKIFRSSDVGKTWTIIADLPDDYAKIKKVCTFYPSPDSGKSYLLVGTEPATIYRYTTRWDVAYSYGTNSIDEVPQIMSYDGKTISAILSRDNSNTPNGYLRSTDAGLSWKLLDSPASLWAVESGRQNSNHIYIGQFGFIDKRFSGSSLYESIDGGSKWKPVGDVKGDIWDIEYDEPTSTVYVAGFRGLYRYKY